MRAVPTALPGVLILEPRLFEDERGCLFESYNRETLHQLAGVAPDFVQDNRSLSRRGVLRGIHYQLRRPQSKLLSVLQGAIFDVVVDLRRSSDTFARWIGVELSAENRRHLWIPAGFGHAFQVRSDSAELLYKFSDYYVPDDQHALLWNDPDVGIEWPSVPGVPEPVLSPQDRAGVPLRAAKVFE
jgi:dTDP-4-dehydrorhamnose 3,5-epimerase